MRLGQLLLVAKKQDANAFYEKLKLVRKEQVVPLSAASYECGTYQRGYEYIVRCVCVCEFVRMHSGSVYYCVYFSCLLFLCVGGDALRNKS